MSFGAIIPLPNVALQFATAINAAGTYSNDAARSGYTIVDKFLVGAITATGTTIELVIEGGTAAGTLNDVFIGKVAIAGNAYDFDGNQVRVTWNGGSSSLSLTAGSQLVTSDQISFTIDGSSAILVAFNIGTTSSIGRNTALTTNFLTYIKSAIQEAGTTAKATGYTATSKQSFLTIQVLVAS